MPARSVAYIYTFAFRYRNAFHARLREQLKLHDITYDFIFCGDPHFDSPRGDLEGPNWATSVRCTSIRIGPTRCRYQHALRAALSYDLIIIQQENALLLNYPVQLLARLFGRKVAFFGHGRNFQARNRRSLSERFKRLWITKVDWWFAYTEKSAEIVRKVGFPPDRITVFNNAIDTARIAAEIESLDPVQQAELRQTLLVGSENVGVYVGGLYPDKRVGFLLDAARRIRRQIPDFHLLVIGGGKDAALAEAAAKEFSWIHYLGPRFGQERTALVSLAKVHLMPGAVGLGILDAFAHGAPLATTDVPNHGPEIAYFEQDRNGVMTAAGDVDAYSEAIIRILRDAAWRKELQHGAASSIKNYSIEEMAQRFARGIRSALGV